MQFSISQISKLTNVSANTLRNWEKLGLIEPERTDGNHRIYSKKDFYRIKYILYLNKEKKIPFSEIKTHLENPYNTELYGNYLPTNEYFIDIDWKEERNKRSLSLQELSDEVDISVSYLSKIENGTTNVSLNILEKLGDFYDKPILDLPKRQQSNIKNKTVIKSDERMTYPLNIPNVLVELLGQTEDSNVTMTLYTIPANAKREKSHSHRGFEIIYVKKGKCVFYLDDEVHQLEEGDSIQFHSQKTHSWKNNSDDETELIWLFVNL